MIGSTLGRYHIIGQLGQGGMGTVWKAEDTLLGRTVALKLLPDMLAHTADARHRFLHEARAASALDHAGIATVYDVGEADGRLYMAVQYVDGETLTEIAARGPLPIPEVLRIGVAVADALAHAHAQGVTHRDVTGRNIMRAGDGRVVILDFGLAHREGTSRITQIGSRLGTVAYMAPEVALGHAADQRSDLYSLGVVLYEIATGRLPYDGDRTEALLYGAVHVTPVPPSARRSEIPAPLDRIILRALAKAPEKRYAIAEAMLADLEALGREPDVPLPRRRRAERRRLPRLARPPIMPVEVPKGVVLAVLPFEDVSDVETGVSERARFAYGLAETLSAALAARHGLQVVPPAAAPPGLRADADVVRASRQLGANLVLCGTVQRSQERLRIGYTLLDPARSLLIAGETLDGTAADLLALEDRLVGSVVAALRLPPGPARTPRHEAFGDTAAHEHYLQALGYLQRHENEASLDGAITLLERLLEGEGENALIQAAYGRACLSKYRLTFQREWEERAAAACECASALAPRAPEVLITLGDLHRDLGRYAEAAREYQHALKLKRENPEALMGLAWVYEAQGKIALAERTCREAIALRPSHWRGYNQLGVLFFNRARYAQAVAPWTRVVALTPDNVRGHSNLGAAYFHMGRYEEAMAACRRSIEIQPNADAYTNLGTVHFFLGHYDEAAGMFERGAALRPYDPTMWSNLGDAYRWIPGREEKAAAAFDQAVALLRERLEINPNKGTLWASLALCLAKRGQPREAVRCVKRALKLSPTNVNCVAKSVTVYHLAADHANALAALQSAVREGYDVAELERDPELAALREDPEYAMIVREGQRH